MGRSWSSSNIPTRSRSPTAATRLLRPAIVQKKVTNGYRAMWAATSAADIRIVVDTNRL